MKALGSKGKIEHVLNFVFSNLQCNINLKEYDHKKCNHARTGQPQHLKMNDFDNKFLN